MASITAKWQFKVLMAVSVAVFGFLSALYTLWTILTHPISCCTKKHRPFSPECLDDPSLGSHQYMSANGLKFHYVLKGDRTKPLMLMLHGFPEFWFSWRHQIVEFCKGYRVIALDMRGYGDTAHPPNKSDYTFDKLTQDIVALISQFGYAKCTLVAHDWGGVIAWRVVQRHPELVDNFIVMNCPHPKIYAKTMSKNWRQFFKSWYIFLFQIPRLPEFMLGLRDYQLLENMFTKPPLGAIAKDAFPQEVIEAYKFNFSGKKAFTYPINYYRSMFLNAKNDRDTKERTQPFPKITIPTLLIWGDSDAALDPSMADQHTAVVENITIKHIPNCSHWVQQEQPEMVNKYMWDFLKEQDDN